MEQVIWHIMGIIEAIGMPIPMGIVAGVFMEGIVIGICAAAFIGDILVR